MANTIDWGQAAVNNTNGFGKSATNNTIDFGEICADSWSPETNLVGGGAVFSNTQSILTDGVDDFVNMGNVLNMADDGTDAFTFSFWCKGISGTYIRQYFGKMTSTIHGYGMYRVGNIIYLFLGDYSSACIMARYTFSDSTDGNWHHFAWTYDGSEDVSGFTLYIDNTPVTLLTQFNNAPITNVVTTANFTIGSRNTLYEMNANFDEFAYFNSELSQSDVTSIYGGGVPSSLSSYSSLVSWWRCGDNDTSPTLTDNGSGGNDGTMTNFSTFSTDVPT